MKSVLRATILFLALGACSCEKENTITTDDSAVSVKADDVTEVITNAVTLNGSISITGDAPDGLAACFYYSKDVSEQKELLSQGKRVDATIADNKSFSARLSSLEPNTVYHYIACVEIAEKKAYSAVFRFQTKDYSFTPSSSLEAVDLGLSVKWANMNLGASAPEDYGAFFAWGETKPKAKYDWSTYTLCEGSSNTQIKYNTEESCGKVDNLVTLLPEDDAATVCWGQGWRIPTSDEIGELRNGNNCSWKWTTVNGAAGVQVTSKINGCSIFLPVGGGIDGEDVFQPEEGLYLSSSLYQSGPFQAHNLRFTSKNIYISRGDRYFGLAVRPVIAK